MRKGEEQTMKKWWIALGLTATIVVAGCSNTTTEDLVKENVTLTEQEQNEFMDSYFKNVTPDTAMEPSEMAIELNKNVSGLSEENASQAIDALIYVIYQKRDQMDGVAKGLSTTLASYEEKGLDLNDPSIIDSIEDPIAKSFLEQMHERFLLIDKKGEEYTVVSNFDVLLNQYGSFMAEDLKAMVEFSKDEYENPYLDEKSQAFNYKLIAERIVLMEKLKTKHSTSYYASWFEQSKNFYAQLYFGMSGNDITNNDDTIKEDVLKAYTDALSVHEGTEFAQSLAKVLDMYKAEGSKFTDNLYVYLLDVTKTEHESMESAETNESEVGEKAKDTIKDAIKAKSDSKETTEKDVK